MKAEKRRRDGSSHQVESEGQVATLQVVMVMLVVMVMVMKILSTVSLIEQLFWLATSIQGGCPQKIFCRW